MRTLAKEPGRENVEVVSADLVAMSKATQPADVLWLHLFYHDLHTALIQKKGATAADFNRAVYERLKPGGSYVIVDHAAAVGAGTSDAQSLHRIEPASVREEVEAAGFVLDLSLIHILISGAIEAMAEAAALLRVYGADAERFFSVMGDTLFSSFIYRSYGPMVAGLAPATPSGLSLPLKDNLSFLQAAEARCV